MPDGSVGKEAIPVAPLYVNGFPELLVLKSAVVAVPPETATCTVEGLFISAIT